MINIKHLIIGYPALTYFDPYPYEPYTSTSGKKRNCGPSADWQIIFSTKAYQTGPTVTVVDPCPTCSLFTPDQRRENAQFLRSDLCSKHPASKRASNPKLTESLSRPQMWFFPLRCGWPYCWGPAKHSNLAISPTVDVSEIRWSQLIDGEHPYK